MSAIQRHPDAFRSTRQKQPRVKAPDHLDTIRELACLSCGIEGLTEAAHLRAGSARFAKPSAGKSEKPSDQWCLPLCSSCHRTGPNAQHSMNELAFWRRLGIDPFVTAAALWAATGHPERMRMIVREARATAVPERSA